MEKGALALARILLVALLLGAIVVLAVPDYRGTLQALWIGEPESSPIWLSNQSYYPEVTLQKDIPDEPAK